MMQFAFPPRKPSSRPSKYEVRSSRNPWLRRNKLQQIGIAALGAVAVLFLLSKLLGGFGGRESIPYGTPEVVLVTVFDEGEKEGMVELVKRNREEYARAHGYATFYVNNTAYPLDRAPKSWSKLPALRDAMGNHFPHSTYFFYLDPTVLIANPSLAVTPHIMSPRRLESLMITDIPVVPPDSVIKTFSHLKGERIDLVLCQDADGLAHDSMIIRRGDWAFYFLDAWFDPLYRKYNFQKAERHALEHIVQWHGTILTKLALVPQKVLNSYVNNPSISGPESAYEEGNFIANFVGCDADGRNCEQEMHAFVASHRKRSEV